MVWSWSHSPEAYSNVRENIQNKDKTWLEIVYAEWIAAQEGKHKAINPVHANFNERKYEKAFEKAQTIPADILANTIWEFTEQWATCDNGGFNAHCCPHGCMMHMVPFDIEEKEDHENSETSHTI